MPVELEEEMDTSDEAVLIALKMATTLETQVAGHMYNETREQTGMLDLQNGLVLKPIQEPPRGTREMEFYQTVFDLSCTNPDAISLRQFLPAFYGVLETNGCKYLKLENITWKFTHPSVVDLKIGRKTYDPLASAEKMARENSKFPPALKLGYQFGGMLLYDPELNSSEKVGKNALRSISEERVLQDGLGRFFGLGRGCLRREEISMTLDHLERIAQWFRAQRSFHFFASSLLIVYDTSPVPSAAPSGCQGSSASGVSRTFCCADSAIPEPTEGSPLELPGCSDPEITSPCAPKPEPARTPQVKVQMIDFAHVFPSAERDENYLVGLHSIMRHLQQLLEA